ncbi:hypothetical protein ACUNV4_23775 [Granulosicoccus sp. 3-233]
MEIREDILTLLVGNTVIFSTACAAMIEHAPDVLVQTGLIPTHFVLDMPLENRLWQLARWETGSDTQ